MLYTGEIIDAHHHLWDLETNYYPWLSDVPKKIWLGDYTSLRKNYLVEDFKKDHGNHNVVASVHIQALIHETQSVTETAWLQKQWDKDAFPNAIVAYADLLSEDCEATLKQHCMHKNIRGIRYILNWHDETQYCLSMSPTIMENELFLKNFALLEKYDLSFDMQLFPEQMSMASVLIEKFPNIKIIINHTGMPIERTDNAFTVWKKELIKIASFPNVALKLSGLGMIDHSWNLESIRPYIVNAIEIFGSKRCFFASNFPVDSLYSSYDELYFNFKTIVKDMTEEVQKNLFYNNAKAWYRMDISSISSF